MHLVPTRAHGVIDYGSGLLLIALPWLLGFADRGLPQWLCLLLGFGLLLVSLLTDYELGAARLIPMPAHLAFDALGGAFFAASPWLFGFADRVWLPFLVVGAFEVIMALITQRAPSDEPALA
ncbi:SPW repeat domain-containing protein [Paracraurococcus lichenis]|uniref:SPW repeat-containing integral membrane domain-containing protein n=1 Tax=Paracraurococcus lichenis TaxID=3064888 RepID=A0ABT9E5L3_9PROT|nr:hypothetical protein [Paracraurococcus sp. LOR1-02]MDO9711365.1 hypothetical protein [Paracraurococcus sp. LOR1-02]